MKCSSRTFMLVLAVILSHLVTDAASFTAIAVDPVSRGGSRSMTIFGRHSSSSSSSYDKKKIATMIHHHASLLGSRSSGVDAWHSSNNNRIQRKRRQKGLAASSTPTPTPTTPLKKAEVFFRYLYSVVTKRQQQNFSKRVLLARLFLGFFVFLTGYRLGSTAAQSTAPSSTLLRFSNVFLTVALFVFVGRDLWRSVPAWAKPSLLKRSKADVQRLLGINNNNESESANDDTDDSKINVETIIGSNSKSNDDDDMSDLTKLALKLNGVLEVAQRRLPSDSLKGMNLPACFLALLQILQQPDTIKRRAQDRDKLYQQSGPSVPVSMMKAETTTTGMDRVETTSGTAAEDSPSSEGSRTVSKMGLDEWMEIADSAYNELPNNESIRDYLQNKGYDLIKHDKTILPGYLAHYVAIHRTNKEAIISIKGTSTVEDLITDMCGSAVEYQLQGGASCIPDTIIRAHEGILLSSLRLAEDLQPFIENLLLPQGYRITVVGHSLGAAGAALLAVLLRSRLPQLQQKQHQHSLNVLAFGSPPILDLTSAVACDSFVTTIINNSDVITRCNAGPVLVLVKVLTIINKKLHEKSGSTTTAALSIPAMIKLLSTLNQQNRQKQQPLDTTEDAEGDKDDDAASLLTYEELSEAFEQALETVGSNADDRDQLYVAGKVILMYNSWEEELTFNEEKKQRKSSNEKRKRGENGDDVIVNDEELFVYSATKAAVTTSAAKVLRSIELDGRMLEDHMAPSYKNSLRVLCQQQS